jgi:hypothetical protein
MIAMHVTIEHLDQIETPYKTFFGRTKTDINRGNFVKILIELTLTERAVLDKADIWNHPLIQIPNPAYSAEQERALLREYEEERKRFLLPISKPQIPSRTIKTTIADFCNSEGMLRRFGTIGEARNFALEARKYIQQIKEIIDHNASPRQNETFDL